VGQRVALGQAAGTRCQVEVERVPLLDGDVRLLVWRGRQQGLVVMGAGRRAAAEHDSLRQGGHLAAGPLLHIGETRLADQRFRADRVHQAHQLGRCEPVIERHSDQPCLGNGEQRLDDTPPGWR
jgi:hypothetical protein